MPFHRPKKQPEKLSETLASVLRAAGLEKLVVSSGIADKWREIVGEAMAGHASPGMLQGGKLSVTVDNAVWMNEISLLEPEIIKKINGLMGRELVKEIRYRTGPVDKAVAARRASRPDAKSERPKALRELDDEARLHIEEAIEALEDPELRSTARKMLATAYTHKR